MHGQDESDWARGRSSDWERNRRDRMTSGEDRSPWLDEDQDREGSYDPDRFDLGEDEPRPEKYGGSRSYGSQNYDDRRAMNRQWGSSSGTLGSSREQGAHYQGRRGDRSTNFQDNAEFNDRTRGRGQGFGSMDSERRDEQSRDRQNGRLRSRWDDSRR